ncbi:DUF4238 domain-containing protein (plasmid) [Kitasatospora sp. cg17-2]
MYLRLFGAGPDEKPQDKEVQVVRLASGRSTKERVKNVAASNHFHRVEVAGERNIHLETAAAALEDDVAPALKELADRTQRRWPIPSETRLKVALFITFQHLRGPIARDVLQTAHELIPELIRSQGGEIESTELNLPLEHAASMLGPALPSGAAELYDRQWNIIDFQRKGLATSDVPVMPLADEHTTDRTPMGLMTPGGLYVPLARRTALMISGPGTSERDDAQLAGNTRTARWLNETTIRWARDDLFHHPEDAPLQGIELPGPRRGELRWEYVTSEMLDSLGEQ